VTIPPEKRDTDLPNKLHAELPGILNFALKGCLDWQKDGLQPPPEVTDAVKEYRADMDVLGQWIDVCCDIGKDKKVGASAAYNNYKFWSFGNGLNTMSANTFGRRLKERYERQSTNTGRVYIGLELKKLS